jgi:hypothetical protein
VYLKECDINIENFDIAVNVLYNVVEQEFKKHPRFKEIISYEDILKIFYRSSSVATVYQILIEDYIRLIIESYIAYDTFLKNAYNSVISMDGDKAGIYLRTLICRLCRDENENEITNNFIKQFKNVIAEFNTKQNQKEKISYCESTIGKRNALVLYTMLSDFYICVVEHP